MGQGQQTLVVRELDVDAGCIWAVTSYFCFRQRLLSEGIWGYDSQILTPVYSGETCGLSIPSYLARPIRCGGQPCRNGKTKVSVRKPKSLSKSFDSHNQAFHLPYTISRHTDSSAHSPIHIPNHLGSASTDHPTSLRPSTPE